MKILITAGPTREAIDPVRFITNRSSGKMGYALAKAAIGAGHDVILISGPVSIGVPDGLTHFINVESAAEMSDAVKKFFPESDCTVMCAAVADYRPVKFNESKIKKSDNKMILELERTEDILFSLGSLKTPMQRLVGFAAETENLAEYALIKLRKKNLDWIVANQVGTEGRGFASDNNAATLYGANGEVVDFELMSKDELAEKILQIVTRN